VDAVAAALRVAIDVEHAACDAGLDGDPTGAWDRLHRYEALVSGASDARPSWRQRVRGALLGRPIPVEMERRDHDRRHGPVVVEVVKRRDSVLAGIARCYPEVPAWLSRAQALGVGCPALSSALAAGWAPVESGHRRLAGMRWVGDGPEILVRPPLPDEADEWARYHEALLDAQEREQARVGRGPRAT